MRHLPPQPRELLHGMHFQGAGRALRIVLMVMSWFALAPGSTAPSADIGDKFDHPLTQGGFIELVQTQIPTRSGDRTDLLADVIGLTFGLLPVALLRRLWRPAPI
jgi:hypothetical protein